MSLEIKLKDFLSKNGVKFRSGRQSFILSKCLNCGKEDKQYIRKRDGKSICFKCSSRWNWRSLVCQIAGVEEHMAREKLFGFGSGDELANEFTVELTLSYLNQEEIENEEEALLSKPIRLGFDFVDYSKSEAAKEYLRKRGVLEDEVCERFQLKYQALMNAVVFPVVKDEKYYGWQARKISPKEDEIRLVTMWGFDKSKFLLNYDEASKCERIIVTEGPFDCIKTELSAVKKEGFAGVASFGKYVSFDQIELLLKSPAKEIYIGLDNDATEEVYEVAERLALDKKVFRINPPAHRKDFGECTENDVLESVRKAVPANGFFLEVYLKGLK